MEEGKVEGHAGGQCEGRAACEGRTRGGGTRGGRAIDTDRMFTLSQSVSFCSISLWTIASHLSVLTVPPRTLAASGPSDPARRLAIRRPRHVTLRIMSGLTTNNARPPRARSSFNPGPPQPPAPPSLTTPTPGRTTQAMAPWNRATPCPGPAGSLAYTESPTRRPLRSTASRTNLDQQSQPTSHHSSYHSHAEDRPPSFHSDAQHAAYQQGGSVYSGQEREAYNYTPDGESAYGGYASAAPSRGPTPGPTRPLFLSEADVGSSGQAYREVGLTAYDYAPRTEVDMDLHLDQPSHHPYDAPHYDSRHGGGQERYDADGQEYYDEGEYDDEKNEVFEDSFEGPVDQWEGDEDRDEKRAMADEELGGMSPAVSFAGGFGAPPPVSHCWLGGR